MALCPVLWASWGQAVLPNMQLLSHALGAACELCSSSSIQKLHFLNQKTTIYRCVSKPASATDKQMTHALSDKNYHLKIELFKPIKSLFKTMYVSVYNYYHLFVKLSHCIIAIIKFAEAKALLAQPLLFPQTMHIFFHHIRSWMVGEGQEWRGGGNAT